MNQKRFALVVFLMSIGFFVIVLRAFSIQVKHHGHYLEMFTKETGYLVRVVSMRGTIFDANGKPLAIDYPVYEVFADPLMFFRRETVKGKKFVRFIGRVCGIHDVLHLMKKHSDSEFLPLCTVSLSTYEKIDRVGIPFSFGVIKRFKRYYPEGSVLSHVVGFHGASNEGLEYKYNKYLRGKEEFVRVKKGPLGLVVPLLALNGDNVYTTLDANVAVFVHRLLKQTVKKYRAKSGIVIIMRPDGAIIDMDSIPSYNSNFYYRYPYGYIRNRAITDVYEPGSVFKIVDLAAALNSGIFKGNERINCENGRWVIGGKVIHDVERNRVLTFSQVFIHSSNIGAAKIALKLGKEIFYKYLYRLGFGKDPGIDTIGAEDGIVKDIFRVSKVGIANMAFGQGIGVTALQLADAYCVVANGGYRIKPYIVRKIVTCNGKVIYRHKDSFIRVLKPLTVKKMRKIFVDVVREGTGRKARVPGYIVAGKTGTAQVAMKGRYAKGTFIASFAGFAPAYNPKFVVVVSIFDPKGDYYGGDVAAPLFSKIMQFLLEYYSIKPAGKTASL